MKYLLSFILMVAAFGIAGPPLWYSHAITVVPASFSAGCLAFACYLFDPTSFLAFCAEMRKNAASWFHKADA